MQDLNIITCSYVKAIIMKGMKLTWSIVNTEYCVCLLCKFFDNDYCHKWHLPRGPTLYKCTKFKRNSLFRERNLKEQTFRLIFLLYFMIYFCIGIIPPNINSIISSIPTMSEFGMGTVIVLNLLFNSLSAIFFGYYGDKISSRFSIKRLFVITNVLWIVGYDMLSLTLNYASFISMIIFSAIGTGAFMPLGFSMLGKIFHAKDRGNKFGLMQFGLILGNGLGIIVGLVSNNIFGHNGWRFAYLFGFLVSVIILSIYILNGIEPKYGETDPKFEDYRGEINYNYKITRSHLVQLIRTKSVIGILLSVLCGAIAMSTLANWGIYYLTIKFGSITLATLLFLTVGISALPGAIIGGKISDHFFTTGNHNKRIMISIIGILAGTLCLLGFFLIPSNSLLLLLPLGIIGYFFSSFNTGTQFAIYSEVCIPEVYSIINALNGLMINIGGICGNILLSAILYKNISLLSYVIFLVLVIWLLGSLFWIFPFKHYTKDFQERNRAIKEVL